MNKMAKLLFNFSAIVLFLFMSANMAYCDAPGVIDPGKRVPARTAPASKKPAAKKPAPPKVTAPVVQPPATKLEVAEFSSLDEAIALIGQERYRKALPYILRALKEQPLNADAWYWFGVWNNRTGNFSNAQKYFAKALLIDPNYPALSRIVVYPKDPYAKIPLHDNVRGPVMEAIYPMKDMEAAPGYLESIWTLSPEIGSEPEIPAYLPPLPENRVKSE